MRRATDTDPGDHEVEDTAHEFGALNMLLFVVVLGLCILVAYSIKKRRVVFVHESAAIILVGILVGGLARLFFPADEVDFLTFDPELFYFLLLPPIIFNAGYTLRRKHFFPNFFPIVLFAVFGTLLSTFMIGYFTVLLTRYGVITEVDETDNLEALLFGASLSAVDPVALLSIIGDPELKCDPLLYSLVFGESVLNDAVAIVLFKAFLKLYESKDQWGSLTVPLAMASFVGVSLGSVVVGALVGLSFSYLCKNTDLRYHPHHEVSLLFLFAYGSYTFAEAIELSGIMALFVCGVVLAHYNSYNLSFTSRATVDYTCKTLSQMAEYFVYLYMGMGFFTGRFQEWNATFIFLAIVFCLVSRLFNIFPFAFIANMGRPESKRIPLNTQVVMWFAGLRGAVAFALSQNMPRSHRDLYATTTLCVVIFTTVVCGGLTEPLLEAVDMKRDEVVKAQRPASGEESDSESDEELTPLTKHGGGIHSWWRGQDPDHGKAVSGRRADGTPERRRRSSDRGMFSGHLSHELHTFWKQFDTVYLKPVFGGSGPDTDVLTNAGDHADVGVDGWPVPGGLPVPPEGTPDARAVPHSGGQHHQYLAHQRRHSGDE